MLAWNRSDTFRNQCRKLGAARAVLIVHSSAGTGASALIGRSGNGATVARIRVGRAVSATETVTLIAHELEHVLERIEGLNLLMAARRRGSGVSMWGGGFETKRAIDAGRRVAREVGAAVAAENRPEERQTQRQYLP